VGNLEHVSALATNLTRWRRRSLRFRTSWDPIMLRLLPKHFRFGG
jgi:hypothetical protein